MSRPGCPRLALESRPDRRIGYVRLPQGARSVWFGFFAAGDDDREHRVGRLMADPAAGQVAARE
jgi:hypothetical protein